MMTKMMRDNAADRAARDRAYKLAESGRFATPHDVERALAGEGWSNAHKVMHSDYVLQAVEERCHAAQEKLH